MSGKWHVVKVTDGAEFDVGRDGMELLKVKITAEVDGVLRDYTITFGRCGKSNAVVRRAYARAGAPGGR